MILFATSAEYADLTEDDHLLAGALEARGVAVEPLVWNEVDAASVDAAALVLIRSCWDYHLHPERFIGWIEALHARGITVVNPPALVRWNMHKRYLLDLAARGVAIIPTVRVTPEDARPLAAILADAGWDEAVIKPAVSLNAWETWRERREDAGRDEARFAALRARGDVLVQPFMPQVAEEGEWSLVFFGTEYSHAVLKRPAPGDFRVQVEHGGSIAAVEPPPAVLAAAQATVRAAAPAPQYTRVDGVRVGDGFQLMELECIDPVLSFGLAPGSADRFAGVLSALVGIADPAAPPR